MQLSIIIPSYNHEKFVLSTIRAAAAIDVGEKEILVIDDGSRDESVRILREYIAGEGAGASIRLIARENRGLVRTLNEALRMSTGRYVYVVASDDIPIAEGVASLVDTLEKNRELEFALGNALFMESEQQREFRAAYGAAHRRFFALPGDARRREMFLNYPQPLLIQATVFRRSALEAMGGWREDIVVDDFSLFLRLLPEYPEVGKNFAFRPEVMACFYRMHDANSHRNIKRQFTMVEQALAKLCPAEWRDAALFRNFGLHSLEALRRREASLLGEMFYSTVRHVGVWRFMRAFASASPGMLRYALSGRRVLSGSRVKEAGTTVIHDPPATHVGRPENAPLLKDTRAGEGGSYD